MKRLALALATTAILGFAAPAFAAESDTTGQAQTPAAQANVKSKANVDAKAPHKAKMVQHRRGVNKLAQHDRGLHRGFTRGHYYGYVKPHHKAMPSKTTPNKTTIQ